MITTLIFDAEGVVIDTEHMWDRAQEELLRDYGHRYDREVVKPLLSGRSSLEGARVLKGIYHLDDTAEVIDGKRMLLLIRHLSLEVDFISGFVEFFGKVSPLFKTAIATAMDLVLFDLVDQRLGVRRLFHDNIFSLEDVAHRSKPEPDLFLFAASALGSAPSESLVIEDAPYGVEAARRAGMGCIALATTYPPSLLLAADMVISSYAEIDVSTLKTNRARPGGVLPD
ncbi:MAG: HAD family hydrolase [Acidimicrobiia bacterium]